MAIGIHSDTVTIHEIKTLRLNLILSDTPETWDISVLTQDYQLCCLCNRHEFPVCSFAVLSLNTVRLLSPLQTLMKCCKALLSYVNCIIYCEVHPIALTELATTLEQMHTNSIFKSNLLLCAQIIILWIAELQYA